MTSRPNVPGRPFPGRLRLDQPADEGLARRAGLSMLGIAATGTSRFVIAVLIGRIGGPSLLGATQSAVSMAQVLALLWPTPAGSAAAKHVAAARGRDDPVSAAAVASYLLRRALATSAVLGLVGALLWWTLDFGALEGAVLVAGLTVAYAAYSLARGIQLGAGQVRRAAILDGIGAGLGVVGVALLLLAGVRSMLLLAPVALSYLLYAFLTRPPNTDLELSPGRRREISTFVWLGVIGTLASTGFLQSAVLVARIWGGQEYAGQYAAALALATPLVMLASSVSLSLFPMLAESAARGDLASVKGQTTRASAALIAIMLSVVGPVALACGPIVAVVWGPEFSDATEIVPFLFVAVLLVTVSVPSVNALTSGSNRGMAISASTSLAGLLVGCLAWVVLIPVSPELGVPAGYLIGVLVMSTTPVAVVWHRDRHAWFGMWARFTGALAVLASLLVWEALADVPTATSLGLSVSYLVLWLLVSRRDVSSAVRSVRRLPHEQ